MAPNQIPLFSTLAPLLLLGCALDGAPSEIEARRGPNGCEGLLQAHANVCPDLPSCPVIEEQLENAGCFPAYASCAELHAADPGASDGLYTLADDAGEFEAYCDMTTDGGGWTLIMKATSTGTALGFSAPQWTSTELLNEGDTLPNASAIGGVDAKFEAFNRVRGEELRLAFLDPDYALPFDGVAGLTALELFSGPELELYGADVYGCHGSLLDEAPGWDGDLMKLAKAAQFWGINGESTRLDRPRCPWQGLRFGFGSNDESFNTWGPTYGIGGYGCGGAMSLRWRAVSDCTSCGGCYGSSNYRPAETSGNLWIR